MPDEKELQSEIREYASPACFMHEFATGYGIDPDVQNTCPETAPTRQGEASPPQSGAEESSKLKTPD